jgi:hypothetical protein
MQPVRSLLRATSSLATNSHASTKRGVTWRSLVHSPRDLANHLTRPILDASVANYVDSAYRVYIVCTS